MTMDDPRLRAAFSLVQECSIALVGARQQVRDIFKTELRVPTDLAIRARLEDETYTASFTADGWELFFQARPADGSPDFECSLQIYFLARNVVGACVYDTTFVACAAQLLARARFAGWEVGCLVRFPWLQEASQSCSN